MYIYRYVYVYIYVNANAYISDSYKSSRCAYLKRSRSIRIKNKL